MKISGRLVRKKQILFIIAIFLFIGNSSAQLYGDGSDGEIVRSSSGAESGIIEAQTYKVQSGVTSSIDGTTVIHATEKITIDGTLESTSNNGGSGGAPRNDGENGGSGRYVRGGGVGGSTGSNSDSGDGQPGSSYGGAGGGGYGACNGGEPGGTGGNAGGKTDNIPPETQINSISGNTYLGDRSGWSELYSLPSNIGAGGGGGGGGGESETGSASRQGGKGGAGGGMIILIAPEIEITGKLYSKGEDGQNGEKAEDGSSCYGEGGGGGGGGGSGGLIYLVSDNLTESGSVDVSGGKGGKGLTNDGWAHTGADGASGKNGEIYRIDAESNTAPNPPSNPNPKNSETKVEINTDLEVDASDPDGDETNITFYNESGNSIGTETRVCSGCTASISTSEKRIASDAGETYSWYAIADDGSETKKSNTWNFTTVHKPEASNPAPLKENVSLSSDLKLDVDHPDDLDMDVAFRIDKNQDGTYNTVGTDTVTGGSGTATAELGLETNTSYRWKAEIYTQGYSTTREVGPWKFNTSGTSIIETETNNTAANNPELSFSLKKSVEELKIVDESGETVAIENDPSNKISLSILSNLNPNTQYEWTTEASTPSGTQMLDFYFTTMQSQLKIDRVEKAKSYNIYRSKQENGEYSLVDSEKPNASDIILDKSNGLIENETYCYRITALTEDSIESSKSQAKCLDQPLEVNGK